MDDLVLALDFGGTKLSAALFEQDPTSGRKDTGTQGDLASAPLSPGVPASTPRLLDLRRVVTPDDADAAYEYRTMIALARDLLTGRQPLRVGVSFGGPVDYARGLVRLSHHVRGWEATPLAALLQGEFGAPAVVDNDANIAALAEHRYGAGRGYDHLMYITVSTGVGGGWILNGRPWRGHEGMAGEIGHTVVDPLGPVCLCGKRGCVERLASGPYMAADYAERRGRVEDDGPQTTDHAQMDDNGLSSAVRGHGEKGAHKETPLTGRDVAERAVAGDPLATEILLRGARALGVGIGHAANFVNPQRFILGGGVAKAGSAWWGAVLESAAATALPEFSFEIVPAALGDDAPLWGALALALWE